MKTKPNEGDKRTRHCFIFKKTINGESRYFQRAKWEEVYKDPDWLGWDTTCTWIPTKWID